MMAGQLLRGIGLYPSQELVMMRLWTAGPQRHCDLVRMLESEAPTMTRTIQRLEKAGLVRTSRSSADRRSIVVEPTKESLAMREKVEAAWTELEARTAGEWDEVKQKQILAALSELETNLLSAEEPEEPGSECSSL
jgi:DNA-binding MarR family transcriptional regulator